MYSLLPSACLSVLLSISLGQAYTVYDTNYEYEVGDTQAREEILITETPEILSLPQHLVVRRGQTVRLPCLVDRLEGYVLLWRKDDNIVSVGSQVLDSSGGISVEECDNGATLVLSGLQGDISGEYVCSVSTYIKTEVRHTVTTRVEPVITTQREVRVREGENARLTCQLQEGSPIPNLRWRKCEGETYLDGKKDVVENVLILSSVSRHDSGCYVCVADGDEPVTSETMLVVEHSLDTADSEEKIKEVKSVAKPSKSERKVYFARVPSLYTIPEKQNKQLTGGKGISLQQHPKNAKEFLKLLRIYHQETFPQEGATKNFFDGNHDPEDSTESKLLRSTHSYLKHLEDKMIQKNHSKSDNNEKLMQSGHKDKKGQADNKVLVHLNNTFEKANDDIKEENYILGNEEGQSKEPNIVEEEEHSLQTTPEETEKVTGYRYLKEAQLRGITKEIQEDAQKTTSKVLRGHHMLLSSLAENNNEQFFSVDTDLHQKGLVESNDTDEMTVLDKSKVDMMDIKTNKAIDTQTKLEVNKIPKNIMLTGSRYLSEDRLKENELGIRKDKQEAESKVLRGHHSLLSTLLETTRPNLDYSDLDLEQSHYMKMNTKQSLRDPQKGQKKIQEKKLIDAEEEYYPKEIQDIEKQYFKTLSQILQEPTLLEKPPLIMTEEAKPEKVIKFRSSGVDTSMPSHPLMMIPTQHHEIIDLPIHEKALPEEKDEMVLLKSKPLRGVYSYEKMIEDVQQETEDVQEDKRSKEKKRKNGPHPFASLRFRIP